METKRADAAAAGAGANTTGNGKEPDSDVWAAAAALAARCSSAKLPYAFDCPSEAQFLFFLPMKLDLFVYKINTL